MKVYRQIIYMQLTGVVNKGTSFKSLLRVLLEIVRTKCWRKEFLLVFGHVFVFIMVSSIGELVHQ